MNDPQTASAPPLATRRNLLAYVGVAAAAAIAGVGAALWKHRTTEASSAEVDAFWAMSFESPTGEAQSMQAFRGRPLVINFWATWCPPCVEEMPMLDAFFRENAGKRWQVIGLAIDQPSAVRKFLGKTPVTFPIGMAGLGGSELGKSLGNESGGLPFTVALAASGEVLQRRIGRVTEDDLAHWRRAG